MPQEVGEKGERKVEVSNPVHGAQVDHTTRDKPCFYSIK